MQFSRSREQGTALINLSPRRLSLSSHTHWFRIFYTVSGSSGRLPSSSGTSSLGTSRCSTSHSTPSPRSSPQDSTPSGTVEPLLRVHHPAPSLQLLSTVSKAAKLIPLLASRYFQKVPIWWRWYCWICPEAGRCMGWWCHSSVTS